jgi:riboflavin synthase
MFTGIVEDVGELIHAGEGARMRRFTFRSSRITDDLQVGGSVAVDGACLTATSVAEDSFTVEAVGTTLSRTLAKHYRVGTRVNLERAARMNARLDGHLVQGHVDGTGELLSTKAEGDYWILDFRIPQHIVQVTVLHGSITLNGVSLTVNELSDPDRLQVAIIPHTWENTNLSDLREGDPVNVEGDLVGKYVYRILGKGRSEIGPANEEAPWGSKA